MIKTVSQYGFGLQTAVIACILPAWPRPFNNLVATTLETWLAEGQLRL